MNNSWIFTKIINYKTKYSINEESHGAKLRMNIFLQKIDCLKIANSEEHKYFLRSLALLKKYNQ